MAELIGRDDERRELAAALASNSPELVAVYGRRRVGKTFLVRQVCRDSIWLELVGIHHGKLELQLRAFATALGNALAVAIAPPADWFDAFTQLAQQLEKRLSRSKRKLVLFFDEVPWLASRRSGFLPAFEHFWNSWASRHPRLVVVLCGSSASWMLEKIVSQRGGLHNRVTRRLRIEPFNLREAEMMLQASKVDIGRYQTIELYLALGGIPHYLAQVRPGESAAQNLDRLCFSASGPLRDEFAHLYPSLFDKPERHVAIVRALARRRCGMTRTELLDAGALATGGGASKVLDELVESGFVHHVAPLGSIKRDAFYWLADEYSLFYLTWIERNRASGAGTWMRRQSTPAWRAWAGLAFEATCWKHVRQIHHALGIAGVETTSAPWALRGRGTKERGVQGVQIDLVIDRADRSTNLCEMKFSETTFVVDAKYARELADKRDSYRMATNTKKALFLTLITTYGIADNAHARDLGLQAVTMDALFDAR